MTDMAAKLIGGAQASPTNPKQAGRKCLVCSSPDHTKIDQELVAGTILPIVSSKFGISTKSLARHREAHIPRAALVEGAEAAAEAEGERGSTLLEQASSLREKAMSLLSKAEAEGDLRTALAGVREAARCLELMAKISGTIDTSTTLNVTFAPVFASLQMTILSALAAFPEARSAVIDALSSVGSPLMIGNDG